MTSRRDIARQVEERARDRCAYCRMHQSLQGATFHLEHVVPHSRGGHAPLDNLAWACPSGNLHKANRVESVGLDTGNPVPLCNPRVDNWHAHVPWDGSRVVGQTPIGRATVAALDLNHPRRIQIREAEELFALFPPTDVSE
ncbi:MAG: HNH endonuclease [Candidatus Entotheonellia bacterium]